MSSFIFAKFTTMDLRNQLQDQAFAARISNVRSLVGREVFMMYMGDWSTVVQKMKNQNF